MMLETREGEAVAVPVEPFRAAFKPSDADLQQYHPANRSRYMVPEQRVDPDRANRCRAGRGVTASDQEVAADYNAHKADYAAKEPATSARRWSRTRRPPTRSPRAPRADRPSRPRRRQRRKRRRHLAQGTGPRRLPSVAGDKAAAAVFAASAGTVVGPIQTEFGWAVAEDRFGQHAGRQVARPGARRDHRQAQRRQAQGGRREPHRHGPEFDRRWKQFHRGRRGSEAPVTTTPLDRRGRIFAD